MVSSKVYETCLINLWYHLWTIAVTTTHWLVNIESNVNFYDIEGLDYYPPPPLAGVFVILKG